MSTSFIYTFFLASQDCRKVKIDKRRQHSLNDDPLTSNSTGGGGGGGGNSASYLLYSALECLGDSSHECTSV